MENYNLVASRLKTYLAAFTWNAKAKEVRINISTPEKAAAAYKEFLQNGKYLPAPVDDLFKKLVNPALCKGLDTDNSRLTTVEKFVAFFSDPDILIMIDDNKLMKDGKGVYFLLPKDTGCASHKMVRDAKAHFEKAKTTIPDFDSNTYWCEDENDVSGLVQLKNSLSNPDDIKFYWACRNKDGFGPVMFIQCATYDSETNSPVWSQKESHYVSSMYSALTGTKYYDARPCSFEYWESHPDVQFKTFEEEEDVNANMI